MITQQVYCFVCQLLSCQSEHMLQYTSAHRSSSGPTHRFMSAQGGEAAYLSAYVRGGSATYTLCWSFQRHSQGADRI